MKGCELMAYTSPLQLITESVSGFNNVTTMVDTFTKNESAYEAALKARKSYNDDCRAIKRNYYKAVLESKDNPYVIQQAFNESEGNIIVRFFKFIFDAIKNAFKAIGNFFKDLFSKNPTHDIESDKNEIDKNIRNYIRYGSKNGPGAPNNNGTFVYIDLPSSYSSKSVETYIEDINKSLDNFAKFNDAVVAMCNKVKSSDSNGTIDYSPIESSELRSIFKDLYENDEIEKVDSYESVYDKMEKEAENHEEPKNNQTAGTISKEDKMKNPAFASDLYGMRVKAMYVLTRSANNMINASMESGQDKEVQFIIKNTFNEQKLVAPYSDINNLIADRRKALSSDLDKIRTKFTSANTRLSSLSEKHLDSIKDVSDQKFIKIVKHIASDFNRLIMIEFGVIRNVLAMYNRYIIIYKMAANKLKAYTSSLSSGEKPEEEFYFDMLEVLNPSETGDNKFTQEKRSAELNNNSKYTSKFNIKHNDSIPDSAFANEAFIHGMQVDGSTIFDNLDPRDFDRTDWMDLTLECNYMLDEEMAQVRQDTFVKECLLLTTPGAHISDLINLQEANTNRLATTLQNAGNRIKQIFQKFLEKLRSIGSDRKRYLEKYKNTILNQKPKFRKIEINDYKKAFDNWRKPIIPQPNFTDMKQTCNGTTGDGMQIAIFKKYFANTINVGRAFSDNDSIAEYCKEFFQCGDNAKKIEMNVQTDMNMTDIYNFLYDQKKITDQINNEIKNFQKLMTDISNVAKREQPKQEAARIPGALNDNVVWSSVYESYITEFEVKDEGNNQNQNNGNQNNDSQRLSDNIQNVEKSNVNDNPQDNPDNQNYDEEIATNFSKVANIVIGAKLTSIEFFGKELFDVVRMHVKDFINNETFVRQQQQGTNYNNNQNP